MILRAWRWLCGHFPVDGLWDLMESTGIAVFVGPNGSGKSLLAVASTLRVLQGQSWECYEATHRHHAAYAAHSDSCDECPAAAITSREWARCVKDPGRVGGWCPVGLSLLDAGSCGERLVFSTVVLLDDDGYEHSRYRPLLDYRQLLTIEHADVLFDEVAGVSDASDSGSVPVQVVQWM